MSVLFLTKKAKQKRVGQTKNILRLKTTYRSIKIKSENLEFSTVITHLLTEWYERVLDGSGFSITDIRNAIKIIQSIRTNNRIGLNRGYQVMAAQKKMKHSFP